MSNDNQTYYIAWHPKEGYLTSSIGTEQHHVEDWLDSWCTTAKRRALIQIRQIRIIPADAVVCDVSKVEEWREKILYELLILPIDIPDDLPGDPTDACYEMRSKCYEAFKKFLLTKLSSM